MIWKQLFLCALVITLWLNLEAAAQTSQSEQIPTLTYSELIKNKDLYLGKTVRVKAFHIYGFEWTYLCGGDCKGSKAWVELVGEEDLCKGSKGKLKKMSDKFDNRAEVVYVGKLSSGRFGHMGGYIYQFTVSCVEKFKKLKVELK
jgi:hypothetical protein